MTTNIKPLPAPQKRAKARLAGAIVLTAVLGLWPGIAAAHESFRTVGVITKRYTDKNKSNWIEVRSKDYAALPIWISPLTVVKRDNKKVAAAELQMGRTVVIDSFGDTPFYSEALEVEIVPALSDKKR